MRQLIALKYRDFNGILIVNRFGTLKGLHCPFRVRCKIPIKAFRLNMNLWVDDVAENDMDELFFIILGVSYPHKYFVLSAVF
jgi:hypothetical protein